MILSFIIPTYNVCDKIDVCITSISNIPLSKTDFEVIIVDDSSTDNTLSVTENLLKENKLSYSILRQDKAGQATARNRGLALAKGKYVWMVDAVDEVIHNSLLFDTLLKDPDADLITFNYEEDWLTHIVKHEDFKEKKYVTGIKFLSQNYEKGSYLWNKIYRKDAIKDILFLDGLTHIEDMCFNIYAILEINTILCLPLVGYRYFRYPKHKLIADKLLAERKKANEDSLKVYQAIYILAKNSSEEIGELLHEILKFNILAHLFTIFINDKESTLIQYREIYRKMGLYPFAKTNNKRANFFRIIINRPLLTKVCKFFLFFNS